MEEDIEYLQQLIGIEKEYKYKPIKIKTSENTAQAIQNLIARYKELEEENIHWKGKYYLVDRKKSDSYIEGFYKANEGWKSKVKEKIEELKKSMLNENESIEQFYKFKFCYKILQEFLEES